MPIRTANQAASLNEEISWIFSTQQTFQTGVHARRDEVQLMWGHPRDSVLFGYMLNDRETIWKDNRSNHSDFRGLIVVILQPRSKSAKRK